MSATKELIFTDFHMDTLDERNLQARALGEDFKRYRLDVEIKAATYHELKIEKASSGWQAEVILDV